MVESAEDGYELWFTEEYCVTSGWEPDPECDVVEHSVWSMIDAGVQGALIGAVMRAHGYEEWRAREHMAGDGVHDEATVMLIRHKEGVRTPPPPTLLTPSSSRGRTARDGRGRGLRQSYTGVTRPRRQRDTTSRYTTAMLHTLERAFSEDGVT